MELLELIKPLGLQATRSKCLIEMSAKYAANPPSLDTLYPSRASYIKVGVDEEQVARGVYHMKYPPTPISHLPGAGAYALDSYRIFCSPGNEWKTVYPDDKELLRYVVCHFSMLHSFCTDSSAFLKKWKWAFFERQRWERDRGVVGPVTKEYLEALPELLKP
jgi:methyl-CpG-binding domain protein 4